VYFVVTKQDDNLKYLYYLLQYLPLKNLNSATGVPGLSRRDAYALRGAFPPKEEQEEIAKLLETVDTAIESIAGTVGLRLSQEPLFGDASEVSAGHKAPTGNKLEALIDLRRSLMNDLLSGRVRAKTSMELVAS
jgi:restriction endonuclease S subunit